MNDHDLNQKKLRTENQKRHITDIPRCIRLLAALEENALEEKGHIDEWLRISYELNQDYEVAPAEMVQELCRAFRRVNHLYGNHIACTLYTRKQIILPNEIIRAAEYMSMGGTFRDACNLADAGIFMSDYDLFEDDLKREIVSLVNSGGKEFEVNRLINSWEPRQAEFQYPTYHI